MLVAALALLPSAALRAAPAGAILVTNTSLETDANNDQWPDGWPKVKAGGSWEAEEGNRFIRLTSTAPGAMVMLYHEVKIPEGTQAMDLAWRQRVTGLQVGAQPWFDARIMMEFLNAAREKVAPAPKVPYSRKDTAGWEAKSLRIDVPEGAAILKFMPALFQVAAGTFDLDDIVIRAADAATPK